MSTKGMRVIRIPFSCCLSDFRFFNFIHYNKNIYTRALSFSATFSYAGTGT